MSNDDKTKPETEARPTYPGFTYAGTAWDGCRVYAGDQSAVNSAPCSSDRFVAFLPTSWTREAFDRRDGLSKGFNVMFCTRDVLATLDTWVEWDERVDEMPATKHFACRGCGDPMGPYEPDAEYPGDCARCSSDRHREWGDMMTDRPETGGPILTVDGGRVSLHLDRLCDDREDARKQFDQATAQLHVGDPLYKAIDATADALHDHWELAPYIQRIEEAHERLCIAQDWVGAGAKPAGLSETLAPLRRKRPGW